MTSLEGNILFIISSCIKNVIILFLIIKYHVFKNKNWSKTVILFK